MDNLTLQYNRLDSFSQKLVLDFIELLLKRQGGKPTQNDVVSDQVVEYKRLLKEQPFEKPAIETANIPFNYDEYRKRLLEMPPWTDEEIAEFDENIAAFKNWKIEEW